MSLAGILLGLINIAIVVGILLLIGAIIVWIMGSFGFPIPGQIQKIYMAIVALIALYLLVSLLLGLPTPRIVGDGGQRDAIFGSVERTS